MGRRDGGKERKPPAGSAVVGRFGSLSDVHQMWVRADREPKAAALPKGAMTLFRQLLTQGMNTDPA